MDTKAVVRISAVGTRSSRSDTVEQQLMANALLLLPVRDAAVAIREAGDGIHIAASSSDEARLLTLQSAQACARACRTGHLQRAEFAIGGDHRSAHVLPMRDDREQLGALILFCSGSGVLSTHDVSVAQALADIAAVAMGRQRTLEQSESINDQLQKALESRIVIEQAKGVLAERASIDTAQAFHLLRKYARRTRQRLPDVAGAVVKGSDTSEIFANTS